MMLKTFMVGATWNHEARHRATKITHSLSVAPMYLLYKDHKLWTDEMGGVPPTRPVCSAGGGQNDHLSEGVSQLLEPVANVKETGMEVTSTPDIVSVISEVNKMDLKLEDVDLGQVDTEMDELAGGRQEEIDLAQVDIEIENEATYSTAPILQTEPVKIKTSAKRNMQDNINLLQARWVGEINNDIQLALNNLAKEDDQDGVIKEDVLEWLASRRDSMIVEEAWEKVAEVENEIDSLHIPEDNHNQMVLQRFVELLVEHARVWHMEDTEDISEDASETSWTNDDWQEMDSPSLGEVPDLPNMMGNKSEQYEDSFSS